MQSDKSILEEAIHKYEQGVYEIVDLKQIDKDRKIDFGCSNLSDPENCDFGEGLVDYYQMNGFCIALCCAGSDEETPLYFALYLDDKNKFRMYIPTVGNTFNKFDKNAFCSEDFGWAERYNNWGLTNDDKIYDAAVKFVDHIFETSNLDAMLADIANRITLKGNETIPIPEEMIRKDNERWNWNPLQKADSDCEDENNFEDIEDGDDVIKAYPELFEEVEKNDDDVYIECDYCDNEDFEKYKNSTGKLLKDELNKKYKFRLCVEMEGHYRGNFYSNNANKLRTIAKDFIDLYWDVNYDPYYEEDYDGSYPFIYCPLDGHFELPMVLNYLMMACGDGCEWFINCYTTENEDADSDEMYKLGLYPKKVHEMFLDHNDHIACMGKYEYLRKK